MKLSFAPVAAVLAALAMPLPALALGGAAAAPDSALDRHLVMVLSREGARHGACTGTVVAQDVVLTAAHCVSGRKEVAIAYSEGGSHVLQRITARATHPEFAPGARVSIDIALVQLETPLPQRFRPLGMDRGEIAHAVGTSKRIAGFGLSRDGVEASAGTLRSARVSVLPRLFPRFLRLGTSPTATLGDIAICTGDSGGPVLATGSEGKVVVGVVYGREKFGTATSCGAIAQAVRLAPQRDWIENVLKRWDRGS
jgi:hypothetical protein